MLSLAAHQVPKHLHCENWSPSCNYISVRGASFSYSKSVSHTLLLCSVEVFNKYSIVICVRLLAGIILDSLLPSS